MTTKEQERKALDRIRKIVEELGEDSYIGAAFEGCFEIAEENIENDFACSIMQRWVSAESNARELEGISRVLKSELEDTKKALEIATGKMAEMSRAAEANRETALLERAALEGQLEEARKKMLDPWLLGAILAHYREQAEEHKNRILDLAASMADYADRPDSAAFRNSVSAYRVRKDGLEACDQIIRSLELLGPTEA